jgi:hypothetical protein
MKRKTKRARDTVDTKTNKSDRRSIFFSGDSRQSSITALHLKVLQEVAEAALLLLHGVITLGEIILELLPNDTIVGRLE